MQLVGIPPPSLHRGGILLLFLEGRGGEREKRMKGRENRAGENISTKLLMCYLRLKRIEFVQVQFCHFQKLNNKRSSILLFWLPLSTILKGFKCPSARAARIKVSWHKGVPIGAWHDTTRTWFHVDIWHTCVQMGMQGLLIARFGTVLFIFFKS